MSSFWNKFTETKANLIRDDQKMFIKAFQEILPTSAYLDTVRCHAVHVCHWLAEPGLQV